MEKAGQRIPVVRDLGVLNAHPPGRPIRPVSPGQHIAAQSRRGPGDVVLREDLRHPVGGIALGDAAQVDLGALVQPHRIPALMDMLHAHMGQQLLQVRPGGHLIAVRGKAPGGDDGGDGDVKGAARHIAVHPGRIQQPRNLTVHGHRLSPGAVQGKDLALLVRAGQQILQTPHLILRRIGGMGALLPIDGEDHDRVHGDDLNALLGLIRVRRSASAAAQSAQHGCRQYQSCQPFHIVPRIRILPQFLHNKVVYHGASHFSTGNRRLLRKR